MTICNVCNTNEAAEDIRYSGMCTGCYQRDCEEGMEQAQTIAENMHKYGTIDVPMADTQASDFIGLPVATSLEDICVWPCDTWCYREELSGMSHMSDDYETLYVGSEAYEQFWCAHCTH